MGWARLFALCVSALLLAGCIGNPWGQAENAPEPASTTQEPQQAEPQVAAPKEPEPQIANQTPIQPIAPSEPKGKPDLQMQSLEISPPVVVYREVEGSMTILNAGEAQSPATEAAYYINSQLAGVAEVSPIEAGETAKVPFSFICNKTGRHILSGLVDYQRLVKETDENNNGKAVSYICFE